MSSANGKLPKGMFFSSSICAIPDEAGVGSEYYVLRATFRFPRLARGSDIARALENAHAMFRYIAGRDWGWSIPSSIPFAIDSCRARVFEHSNGIIARYSVHCNRWVTKERIHSFNHRYEICIPCSPRRRLQ